MKMAKLQKATLDPTKISGRCGRLKCCLRYEYDTYEELQKTLPPAGSEIVTTTGRARVLGQEILTQQLLVQMEDGRRVLVGIAEVLTVLKTGSGNVRRGRGRDAEEESADENGNVEGATSDRPRHAGGRDRPSGGPRGDSRQPRRDQRGSQGQGPRESAGDRPPQPNRREGNPPPREGQPPLSPEAHHELHREDLPETAPPSDPAANLPPDLPPTQVEQPPPDVPPHSS
jgi:hypothetical protein